MEHMEHQSTMKLEILTVDHHLVGYVSTGGTRFSTWLNLGGLPTITMENVSLRSLWDLESAEVSLGFVLVNRDAILAAIPREAPMVPLGKDPERRPLEHVKKVRHEVVVSLAPFALRGYMHLAKEADLRRTLLTFSDSFLPVTEARVVYTPNPKMLWEGDVVLINRGKAQLYWPAPD